MTHSTTQGALTLFDSLDTIDTDFMIGAWRGEGYNTGHSFDGLLESYHWHGKIFEDSENVHPLVFSSPSGRKRFVNPGGFIVGSIFGMVENLPSLKSKPVGNFFQYIMPLFSSQSPVQD